MEACAFCKSGNKHVVDKILGARLAFIRLAAAILPLAHSPPPCQMLLRQQQRAVNKSTGILADILENCEFAALPARVRIVNRTFPSVESFVSSFEKVHACSVEGTHLLLHFQTSWPVKMQARKLK